MTRILDWIGFQLLMHLPLRFTGNTRTRFGCWCLERAGAWAYRREPRP
jgi:hypothetical protein